MRPVINALVWLISGAVLAACATPAPGASEVLRTRNPADVAGCTAVGNIDVHAMYDPDPVVAKNRAIGLNANTIFDSGKGGVAYRCDKKAAPTP